MPWRESLMTLKEEITAGRATRLNGSRPSNGRSPQRGRSCWPAGFMQISALVAEMNDVLLDGQGQVDITIEWETEDDENHFEGEDDLADVITTALAWDEGRSWRSWSSS